MTNFSDLPNEMVREVARHIMPENILNFSLVSKNIYDVNLAFLTEHRELRERYSEFEPLEKAAFDGRRLEKSDPEDDPWTPNCLPFDAFSDLLADVLANRRVAPYIKELRMQGWFFDWAPDQDVHIPYTEEQSVLFKKALSKYVLPTKLEEWIKELDAGNENPVISLLLVLLQDIVSIKLEHCSNTEHQLREVIERIRRDCIPGSAILTHLERVNLQYDELRRLAEPSPVDLLAFLATVPSLKSLYAQNFDACTRSHDFSCLLPDSSNIRDLGFKRSVFNFGQLEDLLQGLKELQKFYYIYDMNPASGIEVVLWDPARICKLLFKYAQRSLQVLDLRSERDPLGPIEDLRGFEALKELTLSFPSFRIKGKLPLRTLVSWLPRSIQSISLHDIEVKDIPLLKKTISEVVRLEPSHLPRLQKFCLYAHWDLGAYVKVANKMRRMCEDARFELSLMKEWSRNVQGHSVA